MGNITKIWVLFLLVLPFLLKTEAGEYNNIHKMETLLKTQEIVIKNVKQFVEKENERLAYLENFTKLLKKEQRIAEKNIPHYVGNPINAFTLIKRLTGDLQFVESVLKNKTGYTRDTSVPYPSEEDVKEAMTGFLRIQTTYKLNVTELANGIITSTYSAERRPFKETVTPMSARDCYDIGLLAYEEKNYKTAILWMKEALKKYTPNCVLCQNVFTDVTIMEHISQSYYLLGDLKGTIKWTKKLIALEPRHPDNDRRAVFVESLEDQLHKELMEQKYKKPAKKRKSVGLGPPRKLKKQLTHDDYIHHLCGGLFNISKAVAKRLVCYYADGPHPFLRLAPMRAEQKYIRPDIVMYHNMLSLEELHTVRRIAKFTILTVPSKNPPKDIPSDYDGHNRCYNNLMTTVNENSDAITKLVRRTSQVTGINMEYSDLLTIMSYGIGGMCERHVDCKSNDLEDNGFTRYGDRISTILYYLSSPMEGGATVFPNLHLTVYPVERSALFFNNFLPSWDVDDEVAHASCPVLRGSKLIAIKWPRVSSQDYCPVWMTQRGIMTAQKYQLFQQHVKLRKEEEQMQYNMMFYKEK